MTPQDRLQLRIARAVWGAWREMREDVGDYTWRPWNVTFGSTREDTLKGVGRMLERPGEWPWPLGRFSPDHVRVARAIVEAFRGPWEDIRDKTENEKCP